MCKWNLSFYYKCESTKKYLIANFFSNFKELRCEAINWEKYFPSPLHLSPALLFVYLPTSPCTNLLTFFFLYDIL